MLHFDRNRLDNYFKTESSEDVRYVSSLFSNHELNPDLKAHLSMQWYDTLSKKVKQECDLDEVLFDIIHKIKSSKKKNRSLIFHGTIIWTQRIATFLLLPVFLYFGTRFLIAKHDRSTASYEICSSSGHRSYFILQDGTNGYLNSNSKIIYKKDFNENREIWLEGEAYFDVYKDSDSPFRINVNEIKVVVLGTKFNIASYYNEENVEIMLEEGNIRVESQSGEKFIMGKNDFLTYDKINKGSVISKVDSSANTFLRGGKLVFRDAPFDLVVKKLEKWYNVDFEITGNQNVKSKLWATFTDESLEEVLRLFKSNLQVNYRIQFSHPDGRIIENKNLFYNYNPFIRRKVVLTLM